MGTYSRGTYVTLPTDDGDLTTVMSAGEVSDVATINNVFVAQNLSNQIAAMMFKNTCSASLANLLWVGQSDLAPSLSSITLEAYNYSTAAWVGQATNAAAATNATCTLGVTLGTTQYISPGGYTTGRVYQSAVTGGTVTIGLNTGNTGSCQDNFMKSGLPNNNEGGTLYLHVGRLTSSDLRRALLRFDLSSIPGGRTCTAATLYLYDDDVIVRTADTLVSVYKIADANGDWLVGTEIDGVQDGSSCWNKKSYNNPDVNWAGSAGLSTAGTDYVNTLLGSQTYVDGTSGYGTGIVFNADGRSVIQSWFGTTGGNGLFLIGAEASDGQFVEFTSSEGGDGQRPKLVITYV